jgi:hypothetical protein
LGTQNIVAGPSSLSERLQCPEGSAVQCDSTHTRIKEVLFNQYRARFEAPAMEEGFEEIVRVNLVPEFHSTEHEELYNMHLLEK